MSQINMFEGNDPKMQQAFGKARSTFRYFWRELSWEQRRIIPGLQLACVKACFDDPPELKSKDSNGAEHMWINDVGFDGQFVTGTLLNKPGWLKSYREGQSVNVPPAQLSDWMYVYADGNVHGGFTVQIVRAAMNRSERRAHDDAWGLEFGSPDQVRIIPDSWNPASTKKKGLLGLFGRSNSTESVDLESLEHPMAVNMLPGIGQFLDENPDELRTPDELGWTFLHHLAAAGSPSLVDHLLQRGADPNSKTRKGYTPFHLAKILGWRDVTRRLQPQT